MVFCMVTIKRKPCHCG